MTKQRPELELQLLDSIREGEVRLKTANGDGEKFIISRSIANSRVRLERVRAGLEPGGMVHDGKQWRYEFEAEEWRK